MCTIFGGCDIDNKKLKITHLQSNVNSLKLKNERLEDQLQNLNHDMIELKIKHDDVDRRLTLITNRIDLQ